MPRRSKKHCHAFSKDATPDLLLVGSGNPSYRYQAYATAHPTCPCHRLVALATLLGALQAPVSMLVRTIAEPHAKLVRAIAAVKDKREAAGA